MMGVFIAGRGRLKLCCIEADHRGEARIETFSASREATGTNPVSRLFPSPAHMGVLFGPACSGQGWRVKLQHDLEIPCSEVCTHIHAHLGPEHKQAKAEVCYRGFSLKETRFSFCILQIILLRMFSLKFHYCCIILQLYGQIV